MPLPDGGPKAPWPPEPARPALRMIREWGAWWSGDPDQLIAAYGAAVGGQGSLGAPRSWFRRFWERIAGSGVGNPERQRAYLHIPLAGDMASTSAALLFSEAPSIRIGEAHGERALAGAKATETELLRIREEGNFDSILLEAADYAAGLGGVLVKPSWDDGLLDHPVALIVQPDQALPEFRFGVLTAATLWREVDKTDKEVIRHLERHEVGENGRGVVLHRLYRGDADMLGEPLSDEELAAKTGLAPSVDMPFTGLGIHYVPNARPNRRLRGSQLGQSDYAGAEGMLDALDEAWASWMRDIRLGKARILVERDMLDRSGRFDVDHEVYAPLDVTNAAAGTPLKDRITPQQFAIRVDEHSKSCMALVERIVSGPYSPQTFGLHIEGRAESGTALDIRERRTFMTQQRKGAWWRSTIATLSEQLLAVSKSVFDRPIEVLRPQVELADSVAANERQVAETIELLNRAEAVSVQVKVEMAHPDWEPDQVTAEVDRILKEKGLAVPPPELDGDGEPPAPLA